jgi:two-component system response regulator
MNGAYVLIAEDDIDDRMLLQTAFEETGIKNRIEFVGNGCELLDFLYKEDRNSPRFILLDLNMPKKDGRETLKELKQHPSFKKIPVVIFTTTKNESEVNRCYELGANSYIVKPDSFESLVKITAALCNYWFAVAVVP